MKTRKTRDGDGGVGRGRGKYQRMILYEIDLNLHIPSKNDSHLIMSLNYGINP